jgi:hypothetical protein
MTHTRNAIRLFAQGLQCFAVTFLPLISIPSPAIAGDRVDICAEYTNTGKKYHVQAINTTGQQLNEATKTWNYDSYSHYIVIFWDVGQATLIKMSGYFTDTDPSPYGGSYSGADQENRDWSITKYSPYSPCGENQ